MIVLELVKLPHESLKDSDLILHLAALPETQREYTWEASDPLVEGTGKELEDTSFHTESYGYPENSGSYGTPGARKAAIRH